MRTKESGSDIDINLSMTKVARIVEENAGFSVNVVEQLGEGLEFRTFLINDNWVFRFPKSSFQVYDPTAEQRVPEKLELSTNVPVMSFFWEHPWGYPVSVSGYKYLPGKALEDCLINEVDGRLAQQLAKVLKELHSNDEVEIQESTDQLEVLRNWVEHVDEEFNLLEGKSMSISQRELMMLYFNQYQFDLPNSDLVLIHGDLGADHIILNDIGQLAGIIDWSNHTQGNRFRDFVGLWRWGGDAFCAQVLSFYSLRPNAAELAYIRVMGLVSCIVREILLNERFGVGRKSPARALLSKRVTEIANRNPYDDLKKSTQRSSCPEL